MNEVATVQEKAVIPDGLKDYAPARYWAESTVRWWGELSQMTYPKPVVEVPVEEWSQIRDDMIRTTGHTPWIKADPKGKLELLFAGVWIQPALKVWTIAELREMGIDVPYPLGRE